MKHSEYISAFKDLAIWHKDIAHGREGHKSFFRANGMAEMNQALAETISFPCLMLQPYSGNLAGDGGYIEDQITAVFEIRQNLTEREYEGIEEARDHCKKIGLEIIAMIEWLKRNDQNCIFANATIQSVKYDFTGPMENNQYGCRFRIQLRDEAYNISFFEPENAFPYKC